MNENIQKMLELLSEDEEAMKKLSAIRDPDEAYALVTSIHGGYTKEEFIETMTAINNNINQDIAADDLSMAAGGASMKEEVAKMGSAIASGVGSYFGSAALASLTSASLSNLVTAASGAMAATAAV